MAVPSGTFGRSYPNYASNFDSELDRARKLVTRDHKQRWVFEDAAGVHISEVPIPYKDKVSVFWMPIVGAVGVNYSPMLLAHSATTSSGNPLGGW